MNANLLVCKSLVFDKVKPGVNGYLPVKTPQVFKALVHKSRAKYKVGIRILHVYRRRRNRGRGDRGDGSIQNFKWGDGGA